MVQKSVNQNARERVIALSKLEQKKDSLERQLNVVGGKIVQMRDNTDPFGLLKFFTRKNVYVSGVGFMPLKNLVKSMRYHSIGPGFQWFYVELAKGEIDNVLSNELTSYLFANNLYLFNVLDMQRHEEGRDYKLQISTVDGIRNHLKGWGIDEHAVRKTSD